MAYHYREWKQFEKNWTRYPDGSISSRVGGNRMLVTYLDKYGRIEDEIKSQDERQQDNQ